MKIKIFNKKAVSFMISWIFRIVVIIFFISFLVATYLNIINTVLDTKDIEFYTLSQRFLYSPDCFVKFDTTLNKAVVGTIDITKFTQENMDSCFVNEKGNLAAKVFLNSKGEDKNVYNNKDLFDEYYAISALSDNIVFSKRSYPVLVEDSGILRPGIISIEIGWKK